MEHTYKSSSHHTHVSRSARRACAHGAKIHPQMARRCSRSSCGPSARSWFSRATAPSRCCKIVMLEQHRPQPRRASARSHARGGRSGSAQSRQPAAAEAPDTHTRGGQLGLGQSGRHDYGCGAGTRARWRLTSVVGCHRVDQESTGAARAPIAPRHIFAGVHFGGSRMRRPRSCTCGMLHCLPEFCFPRTRARAVSTGGPTLQRLGSLLKPSPHPGLRMDGDSASTRRHGHPPGRCRCSGRLSLPHHKHRHDRVGRNHLIHAT